MQKNLNIEKITFKFVQMKFYPNDFWHKRKIDNFDPYNVFLAIATNTPQRLKTGFVVQGHIYLHILIFLEKFSIPIPPCEHCIVIDAIPAEFVRLLKGFSESKQSTFKKEILLNGIDIKDRKCNNTSGIIILRVSTGN